MNSSYLKEQMLRYWLKRRYCAFAEVGLCRRGRLRADIVALSMNRDLVIIETKSGIADFRSDKKYHRYLDFANRVYIATDEKTAYTIRDSLYPGVGLFIVPELKGRARTVKAHVLVNAKRHDIDYQITDSIVTRMAFRNADFNRYKR